MDYQKELTSLEGSARGSCVGCAWLGGIWKKAVTVKSTTQIMIDIGSAEV
jgi:hypothetical protein